MTSVITDKGSELRKLVDDKTLNVKESTMNVNFSVSTIWSSQQVTTEQGDSYVEDVLIDVRTSPKVAQAIINEFGAEGLAELMMQDNGCVGKKLLCKAPTKIKQAITSKLAELPAYRLATVMELCKGSVGVALLKTDCSETAKEILSKLGAEWLATFMGLNNGLCGRVLIYAFTYDAEPLDMIIAKLAELPDYRLATVRELREGSVGEDLVNYGIEQAIAAALDQGGR